MREIIKIKNLDCAHCAAKMEEGIRAIEGVEAASLSFLAQKLIIEAQEDDFERIIQQAQQICHRVDPNCDIIL